MPTINQLERILENLWALGPRRLSILALVGISVASIVGFGAYYLNKPDFEILYSGLTQQDVTRSGAALTEAGIDFDVSTDGSQVLVRPSAAAQARMVLAEKGLPSNLAGGYELFDKLGSMGLTSFMQEITKVRALEGELARSIQTLRGVRAARVHIAMSEGESFRRESKKASASVVIKFDGAADGSFAKAIRHLVASAVPGMRAEYVQVVSTDGTILAAEGDSASELPTRMIEIERTVSNDLRDKIRRTLAPYLGSENFEISVAAKINIDKRQTNETAYDPKSRVERSQKVVKQADNSENNANKSAVGAEQNIPGEEAGPSTGETSKRSNDRREEQTNYEINTKSTSTESQGYRIDQLAVSVLLNKKRLVEATGASVVSDSIDAKLKEVENLVRTSIGLDANRGDQITVAAVDFQQSANSLEPIPSRGMMEILMGQVGSIIRAITIVAVTAILIMFGVKPIAALLLEQPPAAAAVAGGALENTPSADAPSLAAPNSAPGLPPPPAGSKRDLLDELRRSSDKSPQKRLETIINYSEEQAAGILKQWLHQGKI